MSCLLLMFLQPAAATNGINLVGFGAESAAVGGADVALVRDTAALVINPAGLVHICERQACDRQFEFSIDPYYFVDVSHSDSLGNDRQDQPRLGEFFSLAYAQRLSDTVVAGAGLYVAGGLGFGYENLDSGFGTRGDIVTRFSVLRFAPGIAWKARDWLSLGASLSVNYAFAREEYFLDTSVFNPLDSSKSLFGSRIDGLTGLGLGANLGLKVSPFEGLVLGLTYRSRSKLDLKNGELRVNYEALGAGRIDYRDAELTGISIPQDLQLGLRFSLTPSWMLVAEWNWIDWSRAIRRFRIEARDPDSNPLPLLIPNEVVQEQPLNWRDQQVFSFGAVYQFDEKTRLRAGFNYARQPAPERNLTPLVAAIPERHFALGVGRVLSDKWDMNLGLFYIAPKSVHYSNPSAPITTDARETQETVSVQFTFSRHW